MNANIEDGGADRHGHELRFACLSRPAGVVVVPCDPTGAVDLDALPARLLIAYLGARTMVGRDYACPVVQRVH